MCEEERLVKTQDKKTWELWVPDRTDRSELTGNYRRLSKIPKHSTEASTLRGLWVWCLRSEKTWADENFETEGDGNLEKIMMEASTLRGLWVWCVRRGKTWEDVREEDMRTLSSWPNWPIQTNRKDERCEKMRTFSLKKMETQRRSWWRLWP